jgi:serine/threonine protein kinase KIN1/2
LILEYVDNGNLLQYLAGHGRLKEKQARKFSRQILSALDYCHRHNVVHRDLRLENILLTSGCDVKLKGFVRDNLFSPNGHLMTSPGYRYYSAPEVLKDRPHAGPELDVWSFGVMLYHLVHGKLPFDAESLPKLHANITSGKVDLKSVDATTGK